jgi:hypothetical protein
MNAFIKVVFNLMLPDPKDMPAMGSIGAGHEIIPFGIAIYFLCPVILIAFGKMPMPGTIMPEAGVNEDDNFIFFDRDIGRT